MGRPPDRVMRNDAQPSPARPAVVPAKMMPLVRLRQWPQVRVVMVVGVLILGVTSGAPRAQADTFCDLSPTNEGIGIDFSQPVDAVRSAALQVLPFWKVVVKAVPADAPRSVRSLFAADALIVAQAAKVRTASEAKALAHRSLALSSSPSGRAALNWIQGRCHEIGTDDTAVGDTKTPKTKPTTGAPNPARATAEPGQTKTIDPCTLITQAEATVALGADPGPGRRPDASQCVYGPGFSDTTTATLTVAIAPYGKDGFAGSAILASHVRPEIGEYYQNVSVADRAFMFGKTNDNNPADVSTVVFSKADRVVVVNIFSPSGAARSHVVAIAAIAARRL